MIRPSSPLQRAMLASMRPSRIDAGEALSIAEQIAMQLADDIVNDLYQPNDRIQEMSISERYKVSRGPVREALRILENSGLVQIMPRRGAVVTKLSVDEVADIFDIRGVLAGLGARRMAQNHTDQNIADFRQRLAVLKDLAARNDEQAMADYVEAVQEFGLTISESAKSERLSAMVTLLYHQTLRYSRLGLSTPERRRQSVANWEELVEHIAHGRAAKAEATARRLVDDSKRKAISLLQSELARV